MIRSLSVDLDSKLALFNERDLETWIRRCGMNRESADNVRKRWRKLKGYNDRARTTPNFAGA